MGYLLDLLSFLRHHWWFCWMMLTFVDILVVVGGMFLRHKHLIGCRSYWCIRVLWEAPCMILNFLLIGVMSKFWLAIWTALGLHSIFQSAVTRSRPGVDLTITSDGKSFHLQWGNVVQLYNEYRVHRDHDEDCQFGPTRKPLTSRLAKLATWTKISLNPAFAPA